MATKKNIEDSYSTTAISNKLQGLFELQIVDSQIDKLQILRGELPVEISDLENEIENFNKHLTDQTDVGSSLDNSIVEQKQKIEESEALIEKYNKQQMKVRNNREFDAINKELEFQGLEIQLSNKKIASFESEVLENAEKIKLIKAKIRARKKHLKTKKSELDVIIKSTEKDEAKLISKKKKLSKNIEDRLVNAYSDLRLSSKNGLAVVKVDRGACGGCFSSITAQHHLNIKMRKSISFCENCGRILVPDDIDQ
tara:strand:- start:4136 stop:4897 length:762 start_codon:yes stop_codon:yes gene_type:complete